MKVKKVYKQILPLLVVPFILTGCAKQAECDIPSRHVHKYTTGSIVNYIDSEDVKHGNFNWNNDYIEITKDDEAFYRTKGDLFEGAPNWNYLYNKMASKKDYLEFYYEYTTDDYVSETDEDGNECGYWTTTTHSGWTTNPKDSDNTGRTRLYHHRFYGYRILYKDGKYIKEKSPLADDIRDIIDEYPYFEEDCVKAVYKSFDFKRSDLPNLKPTDFDVFKGPDLSNRELITNRK